MSENLAQNVLQYFINNPCKNMIVIHQNESKKRKFMKDLLDSLSGFPAQEWKVNVNSQELRIGNNKGTLRIIFQGSVERLRECRFKMVFIDEEYPIKPEVFENVQALYS
jgi:phage terminase large subunit GpA-like protein